MFISAEIFIRQFYAYCSVYKLHSDIYLTFDYSKKKNSFGIINFFLEQVEFQFCIAILTHWLFACIAQFFYLN